MNRLSGKVVILTGAAKGMGANHAKRMIEEGAKVILTDITEDTGKKLADELGENAVFMKMNVADPGDWKYVVEKTVERFGTVDVLINNAGIGIFKPLMELTEADLKRSFEINTYSIFYGIQAVAPTMIEKRCGSIINISSMDGLRGDITGFVYGASKFAVNGMTMNAANELGEYNIRVNSVCPGAIATGMAEQNEETVSAEDAVRNIPLKRMGTCDDVSNLVIFLASDESTFISGAEYVIDGGHTSAIAW